MATKKLTKSQLEFEEKRLEIQEKKQLLKETRIKLEFEKDYIRIQKIAELRMALSTSYIINTPEDSSHQQGFSNTEFLKLMKRYYQLLNEL